MENLVGYDQLKLAYTKKNVFVTGDTGFKGSWLVSFLQYMGATVTGYSLAPNTIPNHFNLSQNKYKNIIANILENEKLVKAIAESKPEIIFHLAAQPLVIESYNDPVNTYQTNVIGTLNLLEAARACDTVKAIVCITTDKVYENKEKNYAYCETDELGGYDMYSSSKACCEILIRSYRNSFLNIADYKKKHHILIASARAGNVIGGGDWSNNRLIPDIVKATVNKQKVIIRNPNAVRPWQHVLDCVYGYLLLGYKILNEDITAATAWNFAPDNIESKTVKDVISIAGLIWKDISIELKVPVEGVHEATLLQLDNANAKNILGWRPQWETITAITKTIEWYKSFYGTNKLLTRLQLEEYIDSLNK
jgi:CDP-glucose 4,6-dehydratase